MNRIHRIVFDRPGRSIWFAVIIFAACGVMSCSSRRDEVVAIERTRSFHRPQCPRVNMAKTAVMPIAQARAEQLKPCPGCKPDSLAQ